MYVEFYPPGYKAKSIEYKDRLVGILHDTYDYKETTRIYDATDGALNMRKISQLLPNSKPYLSRFHAKRNSKYMRKAEFRDYIRNNIEGIKNGDDKLAAGYSPEGDIGRIQSLWAQVVEFIV